MGRYAFEKGVLAESDLSGNVTSEHIFLGGRRIARRDVATGNSYDAAGNITADSVNNYLYDAEGRDADGNRVAKGTITSMSCDTSVNGLATAGNETGYVLGPGGEQVTELAQDANGTMNWQRTYVYAGGALIATYDPTPDNPSQPLPSFRFTDWLGTLRATTDSAGVCAAMVCRSMAHDSAAV